MSTQGIDLKLLAVDARDRRTEHWPDDRLIRLFGIELPIIQAPMAGSAFSDMVVAVSEAGGLGWSSQTVALKVACCRR